MFQQVKTIFQKPTVLAIAACLLWATAFVGIKIGLEYSTPIQFAGIRFILAGLIIVPFLNLRQLVKEVKQHVALVLSVTLVQTVLHYTLFYLGVARVPSAVGAIIIGAGPLFVTLAAHLALKDDRMSLGKTLGLVFGFFGIVLVTLGTKNNTLPADTPTLLMGIALLLLVSVNSGLTNVVLKKSSGKMSPLILSSVSMFLGGIVMLVASLFFEDFEFTLYPSKYYLALLWLSFLSAAAVSMWFTALHKPGSKISNLNMWKFLIPIVGALLGWTIMPDESPNLITLLGMLVTASSLLWINYFNRKQEKKRGKV